MVKFTSARPSIGGMKSYYNHRTAFGGQWRIPRTQPKFSTNIDIRVRNYNVQTCRTPFVPFYSKFQDIMNCIWGGASLLQTLLQPLLRIPEPNFVTPTPTPEEEPEKKPKTEEKSKVEEKPKTEERPEVEEPEEEPENNIFAYEVKHVPAVEGTEEEVTETLTTEVDVPKGKKSAYCGWQTLWKAYGIDVPIWSNEGKALRNWFREQYLEGNDIWNSGTKQNFPTKISYNGKEYNFNKETFLNPIDKAEGSGSVNTDNMDKIEIKVKKTTNGTEEYWTLHNKATGDRIDQTQYSSADAANKAGEAWKSKQN